MNKQYYNYLKTFYELIDRLQSYVNTGRKLNLSYYDLK